METSNGSSNSRNFQHTGTSIPLPPKSRCEAECFDGLSEAKEGLRRHQRTYSDSMLTEEVPSWLKELLDEPETESTPLYRSHRRSSSDSIAYLQKTMEESEQESKQISSTTPSNSTCCITFPSSADATQSEKQNVADRPQAPFLQQHLSNPSASRTDLKRVKRHSAQQYRARKVQYIAELERSIQSLQAEGYEVSAELEFLDQQNLILGMENRALKQRLDSLSQEHFIKCLEQEVLEREITRLRNLYQQQQHKQQQKHYGRNRSKRQDLDSSFDKLSLKNKGTESQKAR